MRIGPAWQYPVPVPASGPPAFRYAPGCHPACYPPAPATADVPFPSVSRRSPEGEDGRSCAAAETARHCRPFAIRLHATGRCRPRCHWQWPNVAAVRPNRNEPNPPHGSEMCCLPWSSPLQSDGRIADLPNGHRCDSSRRSVPAQCATTISTRPATPSAGGRPPPGKTFCGQLASP